MDKRWTYSQTTVFNLGYHLIWCPKYRRPVLVNAVAARLRELLIQKADEIGITLPTLDILPDHVHLFAKATPSDSPHRVVQQLKGFTSRILRREFPHLRSRLPTLWTRSYYVESVGHLAEATVRRYIESQRHQ